MRRARKPLTTERLRMFLDYEPATGIFRWLYDHGRALEGDMAGYIKRDGYRYITVLQRKYIAQRLAWFYVYGEWPISVLLHINCDKLDNRIANLRARVA